MTEARLPSSGKVASPLSLNLAIDPQSMALLLDLIRETIESTLKRGVSEAPVSPGTRSAAQADVPLPPVSQSPGTELKPSDKLRAADLRTALLLGKIPEDAGLLIDTKTLARLLHVSPRHLIRLQDLKAVPEPVRLGRLIRWRLGEILEWIEADCPPLRIWVHKRQDASKRKGK